MNNRVKCRYGECNFATNSRAYAGFCSKKCRAKAMQKRADAAAKPPGCMPVPCETLSRYDVDEHRRLDCRRYDACLNYADVKQWPSFSCAMCPVNDLISDEERLAQMAAVMRITTQMEAEGL
jgi:hypothetical protein